MKAIDYLKSLHEVCAFQSTERRGTGPASNSELGRWLKSGALHVNGKAYGPMDKIEFPITSVVLFPKSKRSRSTLL
ncbi:hypothetical protein BcepSauron_371 [Burkholderia phage BcepSauron]|uniref:Uncharacterized protein n=2 Tax=Sarumanvirus TaxID=2843450 RepID=A0A482ML20_9CAUD|nr:hypothetical protein H1O16_gp368 [Burkholderia phage BcepSaruman]YP_009904749.1 hypothetical protein H1O17_gp371 [Burkholderia phage BcepSauron]QBQ74751.1 hypothetical protein BcepSauron_371 [Burkholderia phage BcepSauron]QBX06781.1 hypothetical protein BcepSaruman_368 [Burkholderia phage BcepSaruman]